jgi:hypothetical protein
MNLYMVNIYLIIMCYIKHDKKKEEECFTQFETIASREE